jgi:hypothetical protein
MTTVSAVAINEKALDQLPRRKKWSLIRIMNGLCGHCGAEPKSPKSRSRGERCLEKQRAANRTAYKPKLKRPTADERGRIKLLQALESPSADEAEELRKLLIKGAK